MAIRPSVVVLIPCYNEEVAIGKVVRDFRSVLPDATVYVYDNNSKDKTNEIARKTNNIAQDVVNVVREYKFNKI